MDGVWDILQLERTTDRDAIRRAYARRLKQVHLEDDPEGFQRLRTAYETALTWADEPWSDDSKTPGAQAPASPADIRELSADAPPAGPVVRAEAAALEAALARLVELATQTPPPAAGALREAFEAVVGSPALDELSAYVRTERRLAELILDAAPGADSLIAPATARFRWTRERIGGQDHAVQAVLARADDLRFIVGMDNPDHPDHGPFAALTRPPTRLRRLGWRLAPGLAGRVRTFLEILTLERPGLRRDLDSAALAWWGEHFDRPRLSAWSLWVLIALPLPVALGAWLAFPELLPGPRFLSAYIGSLAAVGAATLAWVYAVQWPRRLWAERWRWIAPSWVRLGWAPAALALVLGAAALPALPAVSGAVWTLGAAVTLWAAIVGEPDRRSGGLPWQTRALAAHAYLALWWLLASQALPSDAYGQVSPALAAAVLAFTAGGQTALDAWFSATAERLRAPTLIVIGLAALLSVQMLWRAAPGLDALGAALVAVAVIASRPGGQVLEGLALQVRHYVMWFGMVVINAFRGHADLPVLLVGAAWLSAGVLITVSAALSAEWREWRTARG